MLKGDLLLYALSTKSHTVNLTIRHRNQLTQLSPVACCGLLLFTFSPTTSPSDLPVRTVGSNRICPLPQHDIAWTGLGGLPPE